MDKVSGTAALRGTGWKPIVAALVLMAAVVMQPARPAAADTSVIFGTAFDDLNRNGARDPGEPPFAGHTIYLLSAGGGTSLGTRVTDADGRYTFDGLAPGTYRVQYASSTWNSLRENWFPTTAPLDSSLRLDVVLGGTLSVDWGLRRVVRSTDVAKPISELVGATGLRVQSYVDTVDASTVHDVLATGLLGPEAAHTTVRFGIGSTSTTSTTAVKSNGKYISFAAVSYATYLSWVSGGGSWKTVSHEYGHAWSYYHAKMTQQTGSFDTYLVARGLTGDPRIGSSGAWTAPEMIAEDYRQLLGPLAGQSGSQVNRDIPVAADVPGLREFLEFEFTAPPGLAAPDTMAPVVQLVSPTAGTTVSGLADVVAAATDEQTATNSLSVAVILDGAQRLASRFDASDGRFHLAIDTTSLADGTHTLAAEATDAAGNTGASSVITVTVANTSGKGGGKGGGRATKA